MVIPTGNAYALRIESDLSVDLPGVEASFLSKVDAAVNNIINEVTGNHINGRSLLEERGLQIDLIELVAPSDIYLQEHTPILAGQPSNITNYHLIAIVDFKPLQAEMKQLLAGSHVRRSSRSIHHDCKYRIDHIIPVSG